MNVTPELVNQYVRSAQPFVESKSDQFILQFARKLNTLRAVKKKRNPHVEDSEVAPEDEQRLQSVQNLILAEIHAALCKKTARYRKHVEIARDNIHLLIGGIAFQVAGKIGIAVAVIAALVAALLRLVLQMGISVFCRRFETGML